ncbi:1-deoxy-D-xylulose 5-phosphate reductoisomerase [Desulfotomaculum arcticum]|uniref:1-deoxy-D-xylulose 5-phosphate reductoisomerase n=1 Tax=Desulfotruncus arcticus DSM 17038 TaxID=1121424 RepID=A0A1I2SAB8_9FIRM|nr:1-deoxy-D-xylulose-5-phosphate reductoisomerase [Desulfotruncus arcticus]SFG49845.1 1-deoxy-D-xylulose 5-phosphate reductoisomerase [Desulfotomaculum arcticum] [Desulfotruncus arcticus DSM 17038]
MKQIVILGSTGSIGRQALQVVDQFAEEIRPVALAAGKNRDLLLRQVLKYKPRLVSLYSKEDACWLRDKIPDTKGIDILFGREGLMAAASLQGADTVLTAISGAVGLEPTVAAIENGKNIALANKETLVAAGQLVMEIARQRGVKILPVDSEHSAVWQCLNGEDSSALATILLTASGGPFRKTDAALMADITPAMALSHPNWQMGPKITVDSATLMNKGLEVIEARWLFNVQYDNINVVIHPESIIHSMVEFVDGSVIAQMGVPDMKLPIQYALFYPKRQAGDVTRLHWPVRNLTFEEPDYKRFPALALAYQAGRTGGTMPAVMNAANEIAVAAFLANKISFTSIPRLVEEVMSKHDSLTYNSVEEVLAIDSWARSAAEGSLHRYLI